MMLSFAALSFAPAFAVKIDAELDVYGGYRWDKISTTIHAYSPPGRLILEDILTAKNVRLWTVGVAGKQLFYQCLLVKGSAEWGRVCGGDYINYGVVPDVPTSKTTADIHSGNTQDFSLGGGIMLPVFCNELNLGVLGGWSFNSQRIKMRNAQTNGISSPILNNLTYKTTWEGPWVGVEGALSYCSYYLNLGYEYHFARWRASWQLDGPDIFGGAYSDKRWSNGNHGQVFFMNTSYPLLHCLEVGLAFKYQYWKAGNGREKPKGGSFAAVGLPGNEIDKIPNASWQSYGLNLVLEYSF
jgi:hypothetical protein